MALQDYKDKLPEADRAAYEAEIAKAVFINSREDVIFLRKSNPAFEAEFVNELRLKNESTMSEYVKDKLPKLVDEEVRKRNPAKDPKDQAIEDMQKQLADMKREAILKDRKAQAQAKLTESGLPIDLADFVIHEDDSVFGANLERMQGLKSWAESEVKKALTGAVGNQTAPKGGAENIAPLEAQYNKAIESGNMAAAIAIKSKMSQG